jgi:Sulfocyanin (SoxE) domain
MTMRGLAWLVVGTAVFGGGAGRDAAPSAAWAAAGPSWMHVDAAHKQVSFTVTASQGGANGTLNFNSYANGRMTVTVPTGWRVHIDFVNSGAGALPHSLEVIRDGKIPPQGIEPPAIPNAETRDLIAGTPPLQQDIVDFTAQPFGRYLWFCGVPTHGTSGMWDRFVVSRSVRVPTVTIK